MEMARNSKFSIQIFVRQVCAFVYIIFEIIISKLLSSFIFICRISYNLQYKCYFGADVHVVFPIRFCVYILNFVQANEQSVSTHRSRVGEEYWLLIIYCREFINRICLEQVQRYYLNCKIVWLFTLLITVTHDWCLQEWLDDFCPICSMFVLCTWIKPISSILHRFHI